MRALFLCTLFALALPSAAARAQDGAAAAPAIGLLLQAGADHVEAVPPAEVPPDAQPAWARLRVDWSAVEVERGVFDWAVVDRDVARLRSQGYSVALALVGGHALYPGAEEFPTPLAPESFAAWLAFLRAGVARYGGAVEVFEIGQLPSSAIDPASFALFVKQSAIAVRATASAGGHRALVAAPASAGTDLDWLRGLWERDLAAYVDILPLVIDAGSGPAAAADIVRSARKEILVHPPAATIWVYLQGTAGWEAPAAAVAVLAAGAPLAAIEPGELASERMGWAAGLQKLLGNGYAPAPASGLRIEGPPQVAAEVLGRFLRESDFMTLVVYRLDVASEPPAQLVVDAGSIQNARIVDLVGGGTQRVTAVRVTGASALAVTPSAAPAVALFQRQVAGAGLELEPQTLEVAATRALTAQEIISRHQQVQREQDDRLERWIARGRIDFHFRLAQATAGVDFSIDSNYFWERGGELEWEQTQYFLNGNQITWKNIPELPLIQPEKVITLPLDLTLDRTYIYRLTGEERVGGRAAYVLEFEPADPHASLALYRGRVWIDQQEFVRLKTALIQSELSAPVLSNEEIDVYAPQSAADGHPCWLFERIEGEQVWNAAGRAFVVRREVTFSEYRINPPADEFAERRAAAYASDNQMLRDTAQGFRYLERQDDGTRTVKEHMDTSQLFAAAGLFKDHSTSGAVPLAGVNWFDYRVGGTKLQANVFFAGVFAFLTVSKPDLFGGAADLTGDASLSALMVEDRVYSGEDEVEIERIRRRGQSLALRLGFPLGKFFKLTFIGRAGYDKFADDEEAQDALQALDESGAASLEFVLPQDHVEWAAEVATVFNRRGWSLSAQGLRARRSKWEAWGLRDTDSGEFGAVVGAEFVPGAADAVEDSYARWGVGAAKEWYLPRFQKLRLSADLLDGAHLDRFSRYGFSFFDDDRLSGFSGSGVRFDRGAIGRAGYSFNLFQAIRFDATLESASVERVESGEGRQSFTGLGLSGNFVAPWKTVVSLSYGQALDSDIPDLDGQREFLLLIFKLF